MNEKRPRVLKLFVIDTNVCISANGRDTHASSNCQLKCIEFLQEICSQKSRSRVFLDERGDILAQYRGYLNFTGSPGVGDLFYKYLHDNVWSNKNVHVVGLTPAEDEGKSFEELPLNNLDRSDRVFLAVAVAAGAAVVNALDTDWHKEAELLDDLNVAIIQVCPEHGCVLKA